MDLVKELKVKTSKLDEKYDVPLFFYLQSIAWLQLERGTAYFDWKNWNLWIADCPYKRARSSLKEEGRFVVLHLDDNQYFQY
jgi:hypothetical protein